MKLLPIDNYKAWKIDENDYPRNGTLKNKIKFFLGYAILAPSTHNTQPWKFKIENNSVDIFPDWNYKLPYADQNNRDLFISLGCCITNILSAASYFNFGYKIIINSSSQENAFIRINFLENEKVDYSLASLFPFITKRYSNKLKYLVKPIEQNIIKQLEKLNKNENISIILSVDKSVNHNVAVLHERAISNFSNNKLFRRELSSWLRQNNTNLEDGMPGFVVGSKPIQTIVGRLLIEYIPFIFKFLGRKDKLLIENSPVIGIIACKDDSIVSWINVGTAFEKFALKTISFGISLTIMDAIVQDRGFLGNLAQLFFLKNMKPKILFRIGYSDTKKYHTPRRNLEKVLIEEGTEERLAKTLKIPYKIGQVKIDKFFINYLKAGAGKPLLLIHGGNIGWGQWYPNISEFAKHFEVYAVDLLGGGRSSRIDLSTMDLEKDLVNAVYEFIKKIGTKELYVVGSSIGGWISLKLALKKDLKVNKIVLSDCIGFTDYMDFPQRILGINLFAQFLAKTALKPVKDNKNIEMFLRDVFYNKNLFIKQEFIDYFYETMATSHNLLFMSRLSSFRGMRKEFILKDVLPDIRSNTLIIWGEKDKLMPIDKNYNNFKLIPNVKINIIKDAGHIPSIEKSNQFNQLALNFLSD